MSLIEPIRCIDSLGLKRLLSPLRGLALAHCRVLPDRSWLLLRWSLNQVLPVLANTHLVHLSDLLV